MTGLAATPSPSQIKEDLGFKPCNTTTSREYRRLRDYLQEIFGGRCYFCGSTENLHFHHANPEEGHPDIPGGINHLRKIYQDLRNGKDLELVCAACHVKLHYFLPQWTEKVQDV